MPEALYIRRLAVLGVGLIGGSLARALRRAGACGHIVGCGRRREHLQRAVALGVIDEGVEDPARAVQGADMVVLAVPLGAMAGILARIAPQLAADAVVTDAGSAKVAVIEAARRALGPHFRRFVPGHPIAGTEHSGVEASFAELFQGHRVILTPVPETERESTARVAALWRACGAQVVEMDAARHDRLLAATSHLPHLLAYTLVDSLAAMDDRADLFQYAAGGFRDFTRIASSDPVMWRDICLANREAILAMLDRYTHALQALRAAVAAGDGDALLELFARAKAARDQAVQEGGAAPASPEGS